MFNNYNNMLYRLVEHYDTNTNNDYIYDSSFSNKNENDNSLSKECFVCLDSNISDKTLIKLKNQLFYFKHCMCDGTIHISCLDKWYKIRSTCPICRIHVIKIPDFKTRVITYFMKNKIVSFIYIKTNRIYVALIDNTVIIIRNIIKYSSLFTFFFILTCIYAEIINQIIHKL
jgi:hypothetical protein